MSQENADVMIEVIDLQKYFKEVHVLKGVSTQITRGEVVAVMGPSGGGKSTFLRCMNRLEEPSSGQIIVEGIDITSPYVDINKVRTEIGMVFQLFNLFPHLTAIENVKLAPMHVRRMSNRDATERGMALLDKVGLCNKANNYPDQLSGGQQQRVAIARALAMQPQIMFFDEPTSALDPEMIGEVSGGHGEDGRGRDDHGGGEPRNGIHPRGRGPRVDVGGRPDCGRRLPAGNLQQPQAAADAGFSQ